jgi:hypothetical protein
MTPHAIADAGLVIAWADRQTSRKDRRWADRALESGPLYTTEPVLAEIAHFIGVTPVAVLLNSGRLVVGLALTDHGEFIADFATKYPDADLADISLVKLSELHPRLKVFTVDAADFTIYRRFRNQPLPISIPPSRQ